MSIIAFFYDQCGHNLSTCHNWSTVLLSVHVQIENNKIMATLILYRLWNHSNDLFTKATSEVAIVKSYK